MAEVKGIEWRKARFCMRLQGRGGDRLGEVQQRGKVNVERLHVRRSGEALLVVRQICGGEEACSGDYLHLLLGYLIGC